MSTLGVPINPLRGDKIQVNDNIYEFTPEKHRVLLHSTYTGKCMKKDKDRQTLYNFSIDIGCSGNGDEKTKKNQFFKRLFKQFGNIKQEEPDNLQGEGVKIIIPSIIIVIYTRLEVLLGSKLTGHTNILTEASNLKDQLYKIGEIQNKHQYRNAPNKLQT